jgi:hypothetical protein
VHLEVVWPIDRDDYLTVCDAHPIRYISAARIVALLGEDDDANEPFNPPRMMDYEMIASSPRLLQWVTLTELSEQMQCDRAEVMCIAKYLLTAVRAGLVNREKVPRTIRGIQRLVWCYRVSERSSTGDGPAGDSGTDPQRIGSGGIARGHSDSLIIAEPLDAD